jgi:hypothetical protein
VSLQIDTPKLGLVQLLSSGSRVVQLSQWDGLQAVPMLDPMKGRNVLLIPV